MSQAPIPAPSDDTQKYFTHVRTGQWAREEEEYALKIFDLFQKGIAPNIPDGVTMRALLATVLNCSPMRVSKKFSGEQAIGKRSYRRRLIHPHSGEVLREIEILRRLELEFHRAVRGVGQLTTSLLGTSDLPTPAELFPAHHKAAAAKPPSRKRPRLTRSAWHRQPAPPTFTPDVLASDVYASYPPPPSYPAPYYAHYYPPPMVPHHAHDRYYPSRVYHHQGHLPRPPASASLPPPLSRYPPYPNYAPAPPPYFDHH